MGKNVRVLLVLDYINRNSGVSSVVMNYYTHIDHSKIRMDFLLYEKPDDSILEYLEDCGSHIYVSSHPMKLGYRSYHKFIDSFFKEHQGEYQVVHVHIPNAAFVVLKSAKKYQIPGRVIHAHNSRGADGKIKKVRNYILNKWGIFYANQYFTCSESAGAYLFGKKFLDKVCVIPNAINLAEYEFSLDCRERMRKELHIQGDELVIGHVGRFSEQKNHKFLIDTVKCLNEKKIKFKLLLLGDGELQSKIVKQVEGDGIQKRVIFAGVVSNVKEYMDAMDIFVLPSLYEGLPCVSVEAQANGLPCLISSNVTKEVKLSEKVRFLGIDNPEQWAKAISNQYSIGSSEKREKGYGCSKLYDYDIMVQAKKLEEKYLLYGNSSDSDVNL